MADDQVKDTVLVVEICDETGESVTCQMVAVCQDRDAFARYAKEEWSGAIAKGNPNDGYILHDPKTDEDLGFTLVATEKEIYHA